MLYTRGIVVCEERNLEAMHEMQMAEDAGKTAHVHGGHLEPIISMHPIQTKFAYCDFCSKCRLIVLAASDIVPLDLVPPIAK
jgi:hypothetical protein